MDPLQSENIQPVRTVWVTRLAEAYPPQYSWACDSQEVETKWATILRTRKLADKREPRRAKTFLVDEEKFLAAGGIVKEDESTVFRDDSTHEVVGVVVRKLIDNPGILEWLDRRVKIACHERRNTRRDDPGYGVTVGYTSGPRQARTLIWAGKYRVVTDAGVLQSTIENSSACAHIWNEARRRLPQEVVDDFENLPVPCMDFNSDKHEKEGPYTVHDGEKRMQKTGVYGPPQALLGDNYARFCHKESNTGKYVVSLTTHRSVAADKDEGGHFYIAAYGIQIRSSADSLLAFNSRNLHGTTLQNMEPVWGKIAKGRFQQRGWALLVPNTFPGLWGRGAGAKDGAEPKASKPKKLRKKAPGPKAEAPAPKKLSKKRPADAASELSDKAGAKRSKRPLRKRTVMMEDS
ncbi:MAG: hypothetical protein LQ350_005252 [Teloschistes chrysophthalmus]|nr:MAG: hypothetical protein LQ350_005252 [Niorma chrysophthalma]